MVVIRNIIVLQYGLKQNHQCDHKQSQSHEKNLSGHFLPKYTVDEDHGWDGMGYTVGTGTCELQKRQWAIPAEPEIFSQIVICLFLHADICDITFFCYVRPVTKENSQFSLVPQIVPHPACLKFNLHQNAAPSKLISAKIFPTLC